MVALCSYAGRADVTGAPARRPCISAGHKRSMSSDPYEGIPLRLSLPHAQMLPITQRKHC